MNLEPSKIISSIKTIQRSRKAQISNNQIKIVCPYHKDQDPSLIININPRHNKGIPLGVFHCLGCGKKGHWSELAEKLNLPYKGSLYQKYPVPLESKEIEDSESNLKSICKGYHVVNVKEIKGDWRGINKKILRDNDALEGTRYGHRVIIFPVYIRGELEGAILARNKKDKKQPSYINSKGDWTKEYGLFGWSNALRIMKKRKIRTLVLVEGPRDCLTCHKYDIPAIAILGTRNMSREKFELISYYTQADKLLLLFDGDRSGRKATIETRKIIKESKLLLKVSSIKLWKLYNKEGKIRVRKEDKEYGRKYNLDPATLPRKFLMGISEKLT